MKVALLQPYSVSNNGLSSYTDNVSRYLKEEGVDVVDIKLGYRDFLRADDFVPDDADLIHNAASYYYTLGRLSKPSVMTVYDTIPWDHPEWMTWKSNFYHRILGMRSIRKYDHLIAISHNTKKDLLKHKITQPITVSHPGINEIYFKPFEQEYDDFTYDLYVGGFNPRKGVDTLINWWRKRRNVADYLVLAGGDGWNNEKTFKLIDETEKALFVRSPTIETLYRLYHNCINFYYPSLYEGYGLPLAEALACGCDCHHHDNSSLMEVKPLHWKDQIKEIIHVYDLLLE